MIQQFVKEIVSIAEASLGGLYGRSALLIGSEERRCPYLAQLQKAGMAQVYEEEHFQNLSLLLPHVHLLLNLPDPALPVQRAAQLQAATVIQACSGRRTPLVIFDLGETSSIEDLVGLLPPVCLYTPDDLRRILSRTKVQIA